MKIYKIILTLFISIAFIGCTPQNNQKTVENNSKNNSTVINEIPEYEYPDEFFNYNFSKDENGNIYFNAGSYFYQLDQQDNLKKIFHRLIDKKYHVYDAKYYKGKFYLLVLKVNHKYENGPLGLATMDLQGNNFQYLNDLIYSEKSLPFNLVNFRIYDDNIYFYDLYNDTPNVYIYSLNSQTIESTQPSNIDEKRYDFYKKYFSDYPYEQIKHVNNNYFYHITSTQNEKTFVQYNPINMDSKQYDISEYYDASDRKVGLFYIDLIDDSWFLFSSKGVFKFDVDFENRQELLNGSIFSQAYNMTIKNNMIVLE